MAGTRDGRRHPRGTKQAGRAGAPTPRPVAYPPVSKGREMDDSIRDEKGRFLPGTAPRDPAGPRDRLPG